MRVSDAWQIIQYPIAIRIRPLFSCRQLILRQTTRVTREALNKL